MNEQTTPIEAGLSWSVSKTKEEDYNGKEVIESQLKNGISKKLIAFKMIDKGIARHGYDVLYDNEKIGVVTSGGFSPTRGDNIGLAYIKNLDNLTVGSTIQIMIREKLYNAAKENDADIAFSGYDRVDLDTGKTVSTEMTQYGTMNKEVDWNDDFIVYANPSLWNKLYRRELVKDLEFLPFRGCNDTLFLIHSYMYGAKKLTFIPDVLYHYYLRSSSQIHNMNLKDIENLKKYLLVTKENAKKIGKYEEYKEVLSTMAFTHLAISWVFMVSYDKSVKMRDLYKDVTKYLDENFKEWRNNKFFKMSHCFPKGFKFIWGVHLLYKLRLPGIYVGVNRFLVDKLRVEVKW